MFASLGVLGGFGHVGFAAGLLSPNSNDLLLLDELCSKILAAGFPKRVMGGAQKHPPQA